MIWMRTATFGLLLFGSASSSQARSHQGGGASDEVDAAVDRLEEQAGGFLHGEIKMLRGALGKRYKDRFDAVGLELIRNRRLKDRKGPIARSFFRDHLKQLETRMGVTLGNKEKAALEAPADAYRVAILNPKLSEDEVADRAERLDLWERELIRAQRLGERSADDYVDKYVDLLKAETASRGGVTAKQEQQVREQFGSALRRLHKEILDMRTVELAAIAHRMAEIDAGIAKILASKPNALLGGDTLKSASARAKP